MGRPGMRVARRKYKHGRIGAQHKVKKEDSVSWFKQRFDGIVGRVSRNEDHIRAMSGRSAWLNECSAFDVRHTVNNYHDDNRLVEAPGSQQSDWRASSKRDLHLFPSLRPLRFCTPGVPLALSTPIGTSTLSPRLIMTCRLSSLPIQACFTSQIHPSSTPDEPGCQAVSLEREDSVIRRVKLLLLLEVSRPIAPCLFPLRKTRGKGAMVVRRMRGKGGLVFRRTDPSLSLRVRRISADMRTDEWRSFFERESVGCHRHGPGWS